MKRKRKNAGSTKVSSDRYLITYADLITLLLGLFVILYASSQVDEEKYKELSAAFIDYFKPGSVLEGGRGVMQGVKASVPEPIFPPSQGHRTIEDIETETRSVLSNFLKKGGLEITKTKEGLVLTMQENLLFLSGKAKVLASGKNLLDSLAPVLKKLDNQITVDGHTDSDPITSFQYESNWHLSGARALSVLYELVKFGVPETNINFRGFGSQRPRTANAGLAGKSKNRRVEITISDIPPEAPSIQGYKEKLLDTAK